MSCNCGTQVVLCDLPIRFDAYGGCSHGCKYCFAQRKWSLEEAKRISSVESLKNFIEGRRTPETRWADWDIPIHWGGMSDPFQPAERKFRVSYECLQLFAKTQYPVVVSTKGALVADPEYLELIGQCNIVVQISMACSKYDKLETGCPPFEERLRMASLVAQKAKRVIVRVQPYMPEIFEDVMKNIPRFKQAGVYGIVVEGMKFVRKKAGMVKVGGDFVYPYEVLERDFRAIKSECHKHGLKFYSGENRLRKMGDSMTCCGIDGLEGFRGNSYNLCHLMNGEVVEPTEKMKEAKTGNCFKSFNQKAGTSSKYAKISFEYGMREELTKKKAFYETVFGIRK